MNEQMKCFNPDLLRVQQWRPLVGNARMQTAAASAVLLPAARLVRQGYPACRLIAEYRYLAPQLLSSLSAFSQ